MPLTYFPALSSLISRFDLVCVPLLLILDSVFCIVLTRCHWTRFCFSTSDYTLPFCTITVIGLISGFDPLRVTPFMSWIVFIATVCWNYDPVYELSRCYWITCTTPICTCNTRFCLTLLKENKNSLFIIVVLTFGSSPVSPDGTIWPDMDPAAPNPDATREAIRLQANRPTPAKSVHGKHEHLAKSSGRGCERPASYASSRIQPCTSHHSKLPART